MDNSGYMLLEILILILVLLLIIKIFMPLLDSMIKIIKDNIDRDLSNDLLVNFIEVLRLGIEKDEYRDFYGIDLGEIVNKSKNNTDFTDEYLFKNGNKKYIIYLNKTEINNDLWEYMISLKENSEYYDEDNMEKIRVVFKGR